MNRFSLSIPALLKQIKDDLWCKESVTGYTYSYTWMANQLGHYSLGFGPSILILTAYTAFVGFHPYVALIALLPTLLMVLKEVGDVNTEIVRDKANPGLMALDLSGVNKNAATAVWFTFVGSCVAAASYLSPLFSPWVGGIFSSAVFLALCVPSFIILKYWVERKVCFQQSGLPYFFRLSYTGDSVMNKTEVANAVCDFINGYTQALTIVGAARTGKTNLACAIGTELSIRKVKVRFGCLDEFLETWEDGRYKAHLAYILWSWGEADVIILDDFEDRIIPAGALSLLYRKKVMFVSESELAVPVPGHVIRTKGEKA